MGIIDIITARALSKRILNKIFLSDGDVINEVINE